MKAKAVGHYLLGKTIGVGTFGRVRLGTHILTDETVAVKILEKARIADVADVERVARELHILKLVQHPHVIQLYEIIETPQQLYLIMEYCSSGELFDYIVSMGRVPEHQACRFFHQIMSGVERLHQLRVVHRDLKPENLLLDGRQDVKIVDFGLSNTFLSGQLLGTACGSPCYAAPEMIAGQRYAPEACDVWSCGVILFALVCGYLPFEDPSTSVLYSQILSAKYELPDFVSESFEHLVGGILNTDPTTRSTVNQIREHPWYLQIPEAARPCAELGATDDGQAQAPELPPLDEEVLEQLGSLGLPRDYGEKCIRRRKHNHVTTTYYLLVDKKRRRCAQQLKSVGGEDEALAFEAGAGGMAVFGASEVSEPTVSTGSSTASSAATAVSPSPPVVQKVVVKPPPPSVAARTSSTSPPPTPMILGRVAESQAAQRRAEASPKPVASAPGMSTRRRCSPTRVPAAHPVSSEKGTGRTTQTAAGVSLLASPRGVAHRAGAPGSSSPPPRPRSPGARVEATARRASPEPPRRASPSPQRSPRLAFPARAESPHEAAATRVGRAATVGASAPPRRRPPNEAAARSPVPAPTRAASPPQATRPGRAGAPLASARGGRAGSGSVPAAWGGRTLGGSAAPAPPPSARGSSEDAAEASRGIRNVRPGLEPEQILMEMCRVLKLGRVLFKHTSPYGMRCDRKGIRFDMQVLQLDQAVPSYAVKVHRVAGDIGAYRDLSAKLLADMQL